jgi:hypothetical protein
MKLCRYPVAMSLSGSCHTLSTTPGSDTDLVLLFIDHWEIDISISRT